MKNLLAVLGALVTVASAHAIRPPTERASQPAISGWSSSAGNHCNMQQLEAEEQWIIRNLRFKLDKDFYMPSDETAKVILDIDANLTTSSSDCVQQLLVRVSEGGFPEKLLFPWTRIPFGLTGTSTLLMVDIPLTYLDARPKPYALYMNVILPGVRHCEARFARPLYLVQDVDEALANIKGNHDVPPTFPVTNTVHCDITDFNTDQRPGFSTIDAELLAREDGNTAANRAYPGHKYTEPGQAPSCPGDDAAIYKGPHGDEYLIECFVDRSGIDDVDNPVSVDNFIDCLYACSMLRSCLDVSFVPYTAACHLKVTWGPPKDNGAAAWGAYRVYSDSPVPVRPLPSSKAQQSVFQANANDHEVLSDTNKIDSSDFLSEFETDFSDLESKLSDFALYLSDLESDLEGELESYLDPTLDAPIKSKDNPTDRFVDSLDFELMEKDFLGRLLHWGRGFSVDIRSSEHYSAMKKDLHGLFDEDYRKVLRDLLNLKARSEMPEPGSVTGDQLSSSNSSPNQSIPSGMSIQRKRYGWMILDSDIENELYEAKATAIMQQMKQDSSVKGFTWYTSSEGREMAFVDEPTLIAILGELYSRTREQLLETMEDRGLLVAVVDDGYSTFNDSRLQRLHPRSVDFTACEDLQHQIRQSGEQVVDYNGRLTGTIHQMIACLAAPDCERQDWMTCPINQMTAQLYNGSNPDIAAFIQKYWKASVQNQVVSPPKKYGTPTPAEIVTTDGVHAPHRAIITVTDTTAAKSQVEISTTEATIISLALETSTKVVTAMTKETVEDHGNPLEIVTVTSSSTIVVQTPPPVVQQRDAQVTAASATTTADPIGAITSAFQAVTSIIDDITTDDDDDILAKRNMPTAVKRDAATPATPAAYALKSVIFGFETFSNDDSSSSSDDDEFWGRGDQASVVEQRGEQETANTVTTTDNPIKSWLADISDVDEETTSCSDIEDRGKPGCPGA